MTVTVRTDGTSERELLHRVVGSVDVARHMIERSAAVYRTCDGSADLEIVAALFDATEALRVVGDALEATLGPRTLVRPAAGGYGSKR